MYAYPYLTVDEHPNSQIAYYRNQAGGTLPVYMGQPYQAGHGLGNVLSGVMRAGSPLINALKRKAVTAIRTRGKKAVVGVIGDLIRGKNAKQSIKSRLMGAIGVSGARAIKNKNGKKKVSRSRKVTRGASRGSRGRRRGVKAITAGPTNHIFQ